MSDNTAPRIVWTSNSIAAPSGYGVQSRLFCTRAAKDGYEVFNYAFYGHSGPPMTWGNVTILPRGVHEYGQDMFIPHNEHYKPDHFITLIDVWVYDTDVLDQMDNLTAWVPIDHDPAPPLVIDRLKHVRNIWSMSRFGEAKIKEAGLTSVYVPHGVETDVYKPVDGLRASARARMGVSDDAFLVVMVAANKGWPSRKNIPEVLAAWAEFIKTHPDAMLYMHTDTRQIYGGLDVAGCAAFYGIPAHNLMFPSTYQLQNNMHGDTAMNAIYNAADVKLLPSAGEGFGIPVIEAQACFPAGTIVQASDIVRGMARTYSGEVVTITTHRGSFDATVDHPIWTRRGWKRAGDIAIGDGMLYTLNYHNEGGQHAEQRVSQVFTGPIEHLVQRLQAHDVERGGVRSWNDIPRSHVAGASIWRTQDLWQHISTEACYIERHPIGLYRWTDRRGGIYRGTQDESGEGQTLSAYFEHRQASSGMVGEHPQWPVDLHNGNTQAEEEQVALTPLSHRGANLSSALQGVATVSGCKAGTHGAYDRVVRNTPRSDENGPLHREAAIHRAAYPDAEYEDVTEVRRRTVTSLPVYNLTTVSGTYTAGGYLVHNCGCPVIVTDATAQSELAGPGYKIKVDADDWQYTLQRSLQARVKPSRIVTALEWAHDQRGNADLRAKSREFALEYDADKVWREYMKPALEAQRESKRQLEAERAARKAARLEARSQKAEEAAREPQTIQTA